MMNLIYALVEKHSEWDEILKFAVSAYNGTVNEVTSFTPNYLWFGRELKFTVGSTVPDPAEDKAKDYVEYVKKLKHQLHVAYELTRQSLRKRAMQCKRYYDRNMKLIKYKAGSRVMIKDYSPRDKGEGKMCAKFSGPYWVIDKLGDVNYRIMQDELAAPKVVHHNRMKPYVAREPGVIPKWVKLISKALSEKSQLNDTEDEEQSDQVRLMRNQLTRIVRLRKERRVVRRAAKAVKPKPRRGRPKKVPQQTTQQPEQLSQPEPVEDRVEAAPTRKSRAGREVRRPARYL